MAGGGWGLALGVLVAFAALARAAHDLWAALLVHLAAAALAAALAARAAWSRRGEGLSLAPLPGLALFLAATAASAAASARPGEALLRAFDLAAAASALWVAGHALRSPADLRALRACGAVLAAVELAVVAFQRWAVHFDSQGPAPHLVPPVLEFLSHKVPGTLINPNVTAGFLLLWLPVLADSALAAGSRAGAAGSRVRRPGFWTAGFACCLAGILLLNSAWALACLAAAVPACAGPSAASWVRRRPRLSAALAAAVLLSAALVVAWRLTGTANLSGRPVLAAHRFERVAWWATAWRMLAAHPWLGVGPGNFGSAFLAFKAGGGQNTHHAHSLPLQFLAEHGLLGALGLAAAMAGWIRILARRPDALRDRWPFLAGLALLGLFGLLHLSLEYLAVLLAAAVFAGAAAAPGFEPSWRPPRWAAAAAVALFLSSAPYLATPFMASRLTEGGRQALAAGRLEDALRAFSAASGLDRLSDEARRGAARARWLRFQATGDPAEAREAAERQRGALELNPLAGALWAEMADYLEGAGRRSEAGRCRAQARRLRAGTALQREKDDSTRRGARGFGAY